MAIDIVVPMLGESITEATVASWLKQPGQAVAADEPVVELETDKATLEIGAPKAGVLSEVVAAEGDDVEVGALLGRIEEGAVASESPAPSPPANESPEPPAAAPPPPEGARPDALPPASPPASPSGAPPRGALDPGAISRSGADGRVTLPDLMRFVGQGSAEALERSGPAVRKRVSDLGLDPATIGASGRDGRMTLEDVEAAVGKEAPGGEPEASPEASPGEAGARPREERVRLSRMRRTIAARLKDAQNTAAILTTFNEVDMSAVIALRKQYRDEFEKRHGVRLGFTSFFAKASVAALKEISAVNAEIDENEIVYKNYYDLGMAVSAPSGLVVPVIRDCDTRSFADIERELAELAAKARDGQLTLAEMSGGTFSISNGGVFGSLMSTPILNRPQSAILGLHKIEDRAVVVDGEIAVRPMMYLALSYDHRIVDGREAVTFLVRIKECIEDPQRLLLDT